MSESNEEPLPTGWMLATFGAVTAEAVGQDGPKANEAFTYIDISSVDNRLKEIVDPKKLSASDAPSRAKQNLRVGDVLVSMTRPNLNAVASIPKEHDGAIGSTGFHVLRSEHVEPLWLYYAVQRRSFVETMSMKVQGALYPAVRPNDIRGCTLPLPPLAEQRRIVENLDELLSDLDAGVAALDRVRMKLAHYRAAVLKAAVEGSLTAEWRKQHPNAEPASVLLTRILVERRKRWEQEQLRRFAAAGRNPPANWKGKYKEPVTPGTTGLPQLHEGWSWATLDQLTSLVTSGSRGWKDYYVVEGAVFIRSQDIRTDTLELGNVAHVAPPESAEVVRTKVQKQDLLVTITGANVAKSAVVDVELAHAFVSQHVSLIRLISPEIAKYIHIFVIAPSGGRKRLLAHAYGAGKPGLNLDNLRELAIPFAPRTEQYAIVEAVEDQLSVIDHLEGELDAKLKSAQELRQSILRDAFRGKLVPQDPNDEPAAELLKRIAAERAARQVKPSRKRERRSDHPSKMSGKPSRKR